jgi:hypothetical protein
VASTVLPPAATAAPTPPVAVARAVLTGYARTLLVPLLGLAALLTGWTLTAAGGWAAALAAVAAWSASSAAWLRRRAWSPAPVHLVTWAAPTALLAPLAGLGWLSADGLVLWAPVTTVLAVGLTLTQGCGPATPACGTRA